MGEYYFKREQFYKDEKADQPEKDEQVLVPEQRVEGVFTVQEKKNSDGGQLFFSRDNFYKKSEQPSKPVQQIEGDHLFVGGGFSINLPKGWPGMANYMLLGQEEEGEQPSIQISVKDGIKAKTAAEYAMQQIAVMEEHLPGYRLIQQEEIILVNGQKAYQVKFCWSLEDNQQLYQQQLFVVSGSNGYNLTALFTEKTYKTRCQEVTSILLSFNPEVSKYNEGD